MTGESDGVGQMQVELIACRVEVRIVKQLLFSVQEAIAESRRVTWRAASLVIAVIVSVMLFGVLAA